MRTLIFASAITLLAGAASAASTGFTLEIFGNDNTPDMRLTNDSMSAQLKSFSMTIGDTTHNFDEIYDGAGTTPPGGGYTLDVGSTSQNGTSANGGRTDSFAFTFTDFDPGESVTWGVDVDQDDSNSTDDYWTVFFNNGAMTPNSVLTAMFSDGSMASLTLPDGTVNALSYSFSASASMGVVPAPAALPLLASALGLAGVVARRKRG